MNTDSWSRLVDLLQSRRVAGSVLIGGLVAVGLWHLGGKWLSATLSPVRPEAGLILVFLVCCAAASLLIDGVTSVFKGASGRLQARRTAKRRIANAEQQRLTARRKFREDILPNLPAQHEDTLSKLLNGPAELSSLSITTGELLAYRGIEEVHGLGASDLLYRLHPEAEADIKRHFWEEAQERISARVQEAGEAGLEFLRLFAEENPTDPAGPTHPVLGPEIHPLIDRLLGSVLYRQKAKRARHQAVCLHDEAVDVVEKAIGGKVARQVIELDPGRILTGMGPGGGQGGDSGVAYPIQYPTR